MSGQNKIAVAMSGGVDSSVTAAQLQAEGYDVVGITMRLWEGGLSAVEDARKVADHLGIEHHVISLEECFDREIMGYFADEYLAGRTPNPCARCNRLVKFGALLDAATGLGAAFMATGHYARIVSGDDGGPHLLKAVNLPKDQTYFLFSLSQEQLRRLRFPLGDVKDKLEVRRIAKEYGLPVAEKSESQDICFIPDGDYAAFLDRRGVVSNPGDFVLSDGTVIGRHNGIHRYTVGQRRGMGIAWSEPLYVLGIDALQRRVVVGTENELYRQTLTISSCNWIHRPENFTGKTECKIRYRHRQTPCEVRLLPGSQAEVFFETPQKGVTPGQVAAIYSGDELIGGGWIE